MTSPADPDAQTMGLFWMLRLAEPLPVAVEPGIAAHFHLAGPQDVAELAAAMGFDDTEPVVQRLQRGCQCHIARVEGQLVSYGWITFDEERIGSLGLSVRLLPGEAYIWDCATLAIYRGQRLYPALLTHIQRALHASGFCRIWIGMDADNLASQAGVERAGFQAIVALLQARDTPTRTFLIRGYPGVSTQDREDAQYALLGDRAANCVTLPLPPL